MSVVLLMLPLRIEVRLVVVDGTPTHREESKVHGPPISEPRNHKHQ